jgi:high-affinity K+ transport system ATPase subunit B
MMLLAESPGESREQAPMDLKLKMILMISVLLVTFGCSLAETRSQNRAIQAENRQVYEIYQQYMQSMNAQRQMSGIPPQPIKSYEDWQKSGT